MLCPFSASGTAPCKTSIKPTVDSCWSMDRCYVDQCKTHAKTREVCVPQLLAALRVLLNSFVKVPRVAWVLFTAAASTPVHCSVARAGTAQSSPTANACVFPEEVCDNVEDLRGARARRPADATASRSLPITNQATRQTKPRDAGASGALSSASSGVTSTNDEPCRCAETRVSIRDAQNGGSPVWLVGNSHPPEERTTNALGC